MELLSSTDVSKILKVSRQYVFTEIKSGKLKAYKIGNRYRIDKKDVEEYLKNRGK